MSFPTVTVTGGRVPSERKVSISVDVDHQFSEQAPARLQIQFRNDAATPRTFLFGPDPPFGPLRGDSSSGSRLHILPADEAGLFAGQYTNVIPSQPVEGCWQLADRYDIIDRGILSTANSDETIAMTYVVLDDPDTDECLPAGMYHFEGEWGERYADTTTEWFEWEFTLTLER